MVALRIKDKFLKAAAAEPSQQDSPVMKMKDNIFHQILKPINQIMINDPVYSDTDIDINKQVKELRQICKEVQMRHDTDDYILKLGRSELLNILQNISDNIDDGEGKAIVMEGDDLFTLSNLTDVIRGNAKIYKEFMKAPMIAGALYQVADNIDEAQSRLWKSGIRRDYSYIPSIHDKVEASEKHLN